MDQREGLVHVEFLNVAVNPAHDARKPALVEGDIPDRLGLLDGRPIAYRRGLDACQLNAFGRELHSGGNARRQCDRRAFLAQRQRHGANWTLGHVAVGLVVRANDLRVHRTEELPARLQRADGDVSRPGPFVPIVFDRVPIADKQPDGSQNGDEAETLQEHQAYEPKIKRLASHKTPYNLGGTL